jgi:hypothetical protein
MNAKNPYRVLHSLMNPKNVTLFETFSKLMESILKIIRTEQKLSPSLELKIGFHKYLSVEIRKVGAQIGEEMGKETFDLLQILFENKNWDGFLEEVINEIKLHYMMKESTQITEKTMEMLREGLLFWELESRRKK